MRITVTEEHIRDGNARNCELCPLALALSEAIGEPVEVGAWNYWKTAAGSPIETLPVEAQEFISRFDKGQPVQPFSFDLPLEESAARPQVDESH